MPDAPATAVPLRPVASVEAALQLAASLHWLAIEQYTLQAVHFARWGYSKLAAEAAADAQEEREHLAKVAERLEFYDVQATCDHEKPSWPRHDYEGILSANLALETKVMEAERGCILVARAAGDELSALVLTELLAGSEEAVKKIEAARRLIEQIGLDNYLADKV